MIETWNRYAYVGNNPLSHVDPLGLVDGPTNCGQDGQCYAQWSKDFQAQFAGGVNQGPRGSWTAASEFWLMSKPVTVTTWGWIPVTPSTTNFAGPSTSNGTIDDVLAYFGQQSVQVGTGLDLFTSSLLSVQGTETPAQAFNRVYPSQAQQLPVISAVRPPTPPTPGQIQAACTILAINANNGFGSVAGDSATASLSNGIVFQQYTQSGRLNALNPSSPNVNALMPLAAPGIFVQNTYYNCLASH